jgi:formylglycine-generating enzyme required for sulfatase activity
LLRALLLVASACGHLEFARGDGGANDAGDGTGDGPPTLSCSNIAPTCGQFGSSPCCGSKAVLGGTFYRSYDVSGDGTFPSMAYPATVSDFRLDIYEVTVGRFRQFVTAGQGTLTSPPPAGAGARMLNGSSNQAGWDQQWNGNLAANTPTLVALLNCDAMYQSWTDMPGANEALPINCVNWFEAFAFCTWDGGFLPTEAEWNYAAAGGSEQRAYPWSNPPGALVIDCSYATYDFCLSTAGTQKPVGVTSPYGDGKWLQADLAGNMHEWTLDAMTTYGNPCVDCANLAFASIRALRGGSFESLESDVRTGARASATPDYRNYNTGVRCARAL